MKKSRIEKLSGKGTMEEKPREDAPDVRKLAKETLGERPFPGGRNQAFRVFFEPATHAAIEQHANEDTSVEICGVVVGDWSRDADGPFVTISESIRGEAATSKFAEVTFTHETWAKINQQMDTKFTQLKIVGWYHTHPDFGIFLSDRDTFIHEHFFSGPGQVAFVVDPIRQTEGVFVWNQGKTTLAPSFWVGNEVRCTEAKTGTQASSQHPRSATPHTGSGGTEPVQSVAPRHEPLWLNYLFLGALGLILFLIGLQFSSKLSQFERLHLEQSATARAWLYHKIRPGLSDEVEKLDDNLRTVAKTATALSKEHLKLLEQPEEAQERWREVEKTLADSYLRLQMIRASYCLTPEESAMLERLERGGRKSRNDAGGQEKSNARSDKDAGASDTKKDEPAKDEPKTKKIDNDK